MRVMILYFPYLFIYMFQLLAPFSYPVTLSHPCDLTIQFLLWGKLYDHDGGNISTGKYMYIFSLERPVFLGLTHIHNISPNINFFVTN